MTRTTVRRTVLGVGAAAVAVSMTAGLVQFTTAEAATTPVERSATAIAPKAYTYTKLVSSRSYTKPKVKRIADLSMAKGRSKVVRTGTAGVVKNTYRITVHNGHVVSKKLVSRHTLSKGHPRVIHIGAASAASRGYSRVPAGVSAATFAKSIAWANSSSAAKVRNCESGNDYGSQDPPYYGAYQFLTSTWLSSGGGAFGSRADRAPKWAQDYVAYKLYRSQGWGPWTCARITGVA